MTKKEIHHPYSIIPYLLAEIEANITEIKEALDNYDLDRIIARFNDIDDCMKYFGRYIYALNELYSAYKDAMDYLERERKRK